MQKITGNRFPYFLDESVYLKPLHPCDTPILFEVIEQHRVYFSSWLPVISSLKSISETFLFFNDKFICRKSYELYLGIWNENNLIGNFIMVPKNWTRKWYQVRYNSLA